MCYKIVWYEHIDNELAGGKTHGSKSTYFKFLKSRKVRAVMLKCMKHKSFAVLQERYQYLA